MKIAAMEACANPMRYIVMFLLAIVVLIYLGVWVSATIWDVVCPHPEWRRHPRRLPKWRGRDKLGLLRARHVRAPIAVALMLRYATWKYAVEQPDSYPASYAVIVAVSLCVSVASLAVATS